jgi:hypothetical protein
LVVDRRATEATSDALTLRLSGALDDIAAAQLALDGYPRMNIGCPQTTDVTDERRWPR